MNPAHTRAVLTSAPAEGRVISFRASSSSIDRHGTIIKPGGIRTEKFDANPVFLWGHDGYGGLSAPDPQNVIGRVVSYQRTPDAFDIEVEFAPEDANPRAEQALRLVRAGFLNAVSIGFIPLRMHDEQGPEGHMLPVYDEVELLEVSLVPIPSNPDAVALSREIATAIAFSRATPEAPSAPTPPAQAADAGESHLDAFRAAASVLAISRGLKAALTEEK